MALRAGAVDDDDDEDLRRGGMAHTTGRTIGRTTGRWAWLRLVIVLHVTGEHAASRVISRCTIAYEHVEGITRSTVVCAGLACSQQMSHLGGGECMCNRL